MRRCFSYHTDLGQNAVFHNFEIQIALIQSRNTRGLQAELLNKNFQNNLDGQPIASCGVFE